MDHYERTTPYSHRYAPEFVEPDYDPEERLPQNCDGTPLDPALLTQIGNDSIFYWAHIYFRFLEPKSMTDLPQLLKLLRRYQFFRMIGFARLPIRCNTGVSTLATKLCRMDATKGWAAKTIGLPLHKVVSYELYPRAIDLPTYHDLAEEEMDRVIGHVRKFFA